MRTKIEKASVSEFINKALYFANTHDTFAYFNPNDYSYPFGPFKHMLMIGSENQFDLNESSAFERLEFITNSNDGYLYCHLNYDLKNQLEELASENPLTINFPKLSLLKPLITIIFDHDEIEIIAKDDKDTLRKIQSQPLSDYSENKLMFYPEVKKSDYLKNVAHIQSHITEGDVYELNYCQEFKAKGKLSDPVQCYLDLNNLAPAPFSSFLKNQHQYIIGASPERFLTKKGNQLISQPIKGTRKRGLDEYHDNILKQELRSSEKEMAENMMIVDLVRNDLARSCETGSVKVDEMFGIYTFPKWHQMISTVSGTLKSELSGIDALKNAFPMGSMTGAPKIKVMELIERYENTSRGAYSGATGYFLPNGDFDFNVTIRSLIYDDRDETASFHVGGAITYDSDPEEEYQECLLKASPFASMFEIFKEN